MHVDRHRGEEQARQPAQREQADEAHRVEHRALEGDVPAVERGGPVEDLDGRGHGDEEAQEREDQAGIERLARDEHVVAPDEEADHRDGEEGRDHHRIAEDAAPREAGDDLRHHAHAGQQHDVDGRVRVEPEHVLEDDRVAAPRGVEQPQPEEPLGHHHQERGGERGRAQHDDDRGRVERPDEERQPPPAEPRRPLRVDGDDEVEARRDGAEPRHEDAHRGERHVGVRVERRIGRVEGPAGIDPARQQRGEDEHPARDGQVPAQEVEPREGHVARADGQRQDEVAERGRDRGDEEEPHHDHAVQREELVVGVRRHDVGPRREELEPHQRRGGPADQEEHGDGREVEDRDPLVVRGQQPGPDTVPGGEVARRAGAAGDVDRGVAHWSVSMSGDLRTRSPGGGAAERSRI